MLRLVSATELQPLPANRIKVSAPVSHIGYYYLVCMLYYTPDLFLIHVTDPGCIQQTVIGQTYLVIVHYNTQRNIENLCSS